MSEFLQAILFGVVQGITEFFPVSSSAHLQLLKHFLGFPNNSPFLELSCHIGTVLCLIWYLRSEVKDVFVSARNLKNIFLAIIPLVPMYFLFKPVVIHFSSLKYLGFFFCFTSFLLFVSTYLEIKQKKIKAKDYLFIGSMQAIALFPGISRSGATISAARIRGWGLRNAVIFSFLLSIPTILGGFLLELWKSNFEYDIFKEIYLVAGISSFLTGLLTIRCFFYILKKRAFSLFAWYCLTLGIILIFKYG